MPLIQSHRGLRPSIDPTAYVAPDVVLSGDVRIGPSSVVLFGAVLTAEGGSVEIGSECVVMENAVLRGTPRHGLSLGDAVLVGPGAHLSGCTVDEGAFVATGATIFNGARIGRGVEVRVNAIVQVKASLAAGTVVPMGWVAVGNPARLFSPGDHDRIWAVQRTMDFAGTVWGADGPSDTAATTRRYARSLARHHRDDAVEKAQSDSER